MKSLDIMDQCNKDTNEILIQQKIILMENTTPSFIHERTIQQLNSDWENLEWGLKSLGFLFASFVLVSRIAKTKPPYKTNIAQYEIQVASYNIGTLDSPWKFFLLKLNIIIYSSIFASFFWAAIRSKMLPLFEFNFKLVIKSGKPFWDNSSLNLAVYNRCSLKRSIFVHI